MDEFSRRKVLKSIGTTSSVAAIPFGASSVAGADDASEQTDSRHHHQLTDDEEDEAVDQALADPSIQALLEQQPVIDNVNDEAATVVSVAYGDGEITIVRIPFEVDESELREEINVVGNPIFSGQMPRA